MVVQVGDQIDRGDQDREVLDLFDRLREEAARYGGAAHSLLGNHELMNASGSLHHVTPKGFLGFAELAPAGAAAGRFAKYPPRIRGRAAAFAPGGAYARRLSGRPVVLQLGHNLFVHGGILPEHASYGLGRMNREVGQWLREESNVLPEQVFGPRGVLWTRHLGKDRPEPAHCRVLAETLGMVGAKRLVVGHTRQPKGINSACDGLVWRIDVSLSSAYGPRPSEVLELRPDHVGPIRSTARDPARLRPSRRLVSPSSPGAAPPP